MYKAGLNRCTLFFDILRYISCRNKHVFPKKAQAGWEGNLNINIIAINFLIMKTATRKKKRMAVMCYKKRIKIIVVVTVLTPSQ